MKKFIQKIIIFILPALIYSIIAMIFMPYFLSLNNGPSTKQQIIYSFRNAINKEYELLILGNSKTYRGLNPYMFNFKSFNFSHDNDSYNQIYHKLNFLFKNQKSFKYLILGIDYFQFSFKSDTRNYVYADYLGGEYMNDYEESSVLVKKMEYYFGNINPKKLFSHYSKINKPFLRENGQYIKHGIANESDSITRDINRLDFQVSYFKKILELCKSKNIKVFLVMLPVRENELNSYTDKEINEFKAFINQNTDFKNVFYLDYSNLAGFKTEDYTDITHFNELSANRFSIILNKDVKGLINLENKARSLY